AGGAPHRPRLGRDPLGRGPRSLLRPALRRVARRAPRSRGPRPGQPFRPRDDRRGARAEGPGGPGDRGDTPRAGPGAAGADGRDRDPPGPGGPARRGALRRGRFSRPGQPGPAPERRVRRLLRLRRRPGQGLRVAREGGGREAVLPDLPEGRSPVRPGEGRPPLRGGPRQDRAAFLTPQKSARLMSVVVPSRVVTSTCAKTPEIAAVPEVTVT